MAAIPFRSTKLVFDKDVSIKSNQGSNRAKSIRIAADVLSAGNQESTAYDIDSLRRVMGISGPSQIRARATRDTTEVNDLDAQSSASQATVIDNNPTTRSDGAGKKPKVIGRKNTESTGDIWGNTPSRRPGRIEGNTNNDVSNTQLSKSRQRGNKTQQKNPKDSTGSDLLTYEPPKSIRPRLLAQPQQGSHALQDYQMQMMLLDQQNKKRLSLAQQENLLKQGHSVATPTKFYQKSNDGETPANEEDEQNSRASDASGRQKLVATYTISEDDTVPESERQKRRLIALVSAAPREWRT